jgi:hypothetical protein
MLIGVISDTHDLLRSEAVSALAGCDEIIHAGDVCREGILDELALIAPVTAVRGNNDYGDWADRLPWSLTAEFGGNKFHIVHILDDRNRDYSGEGVTMVVFGHSHHPGMMFRKGVCFVNPGSAGPLRFRTPASLALVHLDNSLVKVEFKVLARRGG